MLKKTSFGKTLFYLAFLSVLTLSISWLGAEVYLRLFSSYITPKILKDQSLLYLPLVGEVLPAQIQESVNSLGAHLRINSKGYRGREFEFKKSPGTIRIVFYGGSSAFDIGNSDPGDWPHRVENYLRQTGFPQIEVINAGIPGFSTYEVLRNLLTEGYRLRPDYLVLYSAWNDIKYFPREKPLLRTFRNKIQPAPLLDYQNSLDQWFCEISQVYVRLRYRYFTWKEKIGLEGRKPNVLPTNHIDREMLNQYRFDLETFVDLARNIGAVPVLMTEARLVSAHNTPEEKKKIRYDFQSLAPEALERAYRLSDKIIRKTASQKRAAFIDASSPLSGKTEFFYDHVHLSKDGSDALAVLVASAFTKFLSGQGGSAPKPR